MQRFVVFIRPYDHLLIGLYFCGVRGEASASSDQIARILAAEEHPLRDDLIEHCLSFSVNRGYVERVGLKYRLSSDGVEHLFDQALVI